MLMCYIDIMIVIFFDKTVIDKKIIIWNKI